MCNLPEYPVIESVVTESGWTTEMQYVRLNDGRYAKRSQGYNNFDIHEQHDVFYVNGYGFLPSTKAEFEKAKGNDKI